MKKNEKKLRINEQIREKKVKLVSAEGLLIGIVPIETALEMARQNGLDLVEVNNSSNIIICKIMDYGKLKYKESKKKRSKERHIKEIRTSFVISDHDLETKHKQIFKFIEKGYKVKYLLQLKGREIYKKEEALGMINNRLLNFSFIADWEEPKIVNKIIFTVLKSKIEK